MAHTIPLATAVYAPQEQHTHSLVYRAPRQNQSGAGYIYVWGFTPASGLADDTLCVVASVAKHQRLKIQLVISDQPQVTSVSQHHGTRCTDLFLISTRLPPLRLLNNPLSATITLKIRILVNDHFVDEVYFGDFAYELVTRPASARPTPLDALQVPWVEPTSRIVHFVTSTRAMCENWTDKERAASRRLVRFTRSQSSPHGLLVACMPQTQDSFNADLEAAAKDVAVVRRSATHVVVSCIWRQDAGMFCITSVDIIRMLGMLYGTSLPNDEQNRVRRHLECFAPCAIGRRREGSYFFNSVMACFKEPRPTKILKDIKVFDWYVLEDACESIMQRHFYGPYSP